MARRDPGQMTPKAQIAFEIYRDLGPGRTLQAAAAELGYSPRSISVFLRWSAAHEWQRLIAEHDHADLKERLGNREIVRERTLQSIIDRTQDAADVLYGIMMDASQLPILDRHGEPELDDNGERMFKPTVKPSTRANAAVAYLGIGGLVTVKRTEIIDRTPEALDEAAAILRTMSPNQVQLLGEILDGD